MNRTTEIEQRHSPDYIYTGLKAAAGTLMLGLIAEAFVPPNSMRLAADITLVATAVTTAAAPFTEGVITGFRRK